MVAHLSEAENLVKQIDSICLQLFDTWCEERNVAPLIYLMHCWPLLEGTPATLQRLGETMRDLRLYHADELGVDCNRLLDDIAEMLKRWSAVTIEAVERVSEQSSHDLSLLPESDSQDQVERECLDGPRRDARPKLTVEACSVMYDGKVIYEAPSHEEAVIYRDRHIDLDT